MIPLASVIIVAMTPVYDALMAYISTRVVFQILSACIGVIGTLAGIALILSMLAYLFVLDRTSWKFPWLVIFLFTACFGSSVYFFLVYRRQLSPQQIGSLRA
jgi:hypothetical protein